MAKIGLCLPTCRFPLSWTGEHLLRSQFSWKLKNFSSSSCRNLTPSSFILLPEHWNSDMKQCRPPPNPTEIFISLNKTDLWLLADKQQTLESVCQTGFTNFMPCCVLAGCDFECIQCLFPAFPLEATPHDIWMLSKVSQLMCHLGMWFRGDYWGARSSMDWMILKVSSNLNVSVIISLTPISQKYLPRKNSGLLKNL